ncbi:MAG: prepilin-type N-terminal cleavage/methylation domain-containing protein [Candidatus Marinimicrobia bacterium]|nr:prepilin-type N-terminal cleavage/methylation domain-containing protein [Candidatus Neomarinimicrobiota bacterium]MBL7022875.1 prepilin-type N-terminal cleavage/methylation domain-containing protein [Candidatus Neomarinimicrobiota bacterium]MBL7109194.1 prepilin-type N-terminal cleavage/methylation domain-containing protein [Candidatus Neomarinimicrobiota bacterium]
MIKTFKIKQGFTLVEILVSVIIIAAASIAIMTGVTKAKAQLTSIHLEEKAYDALRDYTEYWKARIASNQVGMSNSANTLEEVVLFERSDNNHVVGHLSRRNITPGHHGSTAAKHFILSTKISWVDKSFGESIDKSMEFFVKQIEYNL